MNLMKTLLCAAVLLSMAAVGCDDDQSLFSNPTVTMDDFSTMLQAASPPGQTAPPTGLVQVSMGSETLEFWPYTGENFSGLGQDPINLIFFGEADPLSIRAALMGLDGDRGAAGWPDEAPFNAVWQDAIGNVQTGYGAETGWRGGCIQLACGDYDIARFHLRLFKLGDWTVGNAHFEILIPNTTEHQVISWELAEQFVASDLMRTGLLDGSVPMVPTQQINESPFRTIPDVIYNGLPIPIRAAIGGPLENVDYEVPIGTDGSALIVNLAAAAPYGPEVIIDDFVAVYDQVIPMPFCSDGPYDYVHVAGPVSMNQVNEVTAAGEFISTFRAEGDLYITPVNPLTDGVVGETMRAVVREHHDVYFSQKSEKASSQQLQTLVPPAADGGGRLAVRLRVSSNGANDFQARIQCGDNPVGKADKTESSSLTKVRTD